MADMRKFQKVPVYRCPGFLALYMFILATSAPLCYIRVLRATAAAEGTSPQYNGCARALQFLGNFFVVLYQSTT